MGRDCVVQAPSPVVIVWSRRRFATWVVVTPLNPCPDTSTTVSSPTPLIQPSPVLPSNPFHTRRAKFRRLNPEISSVRFHTDAYSMVMGTSQGHVLLYDLRAAMPLWVKDHRSGTQPGAVDFGSCCLSDEWFVFSCWSRCWPPYVFPQFSSLSIEIFPPCLIFRLLCSFTSFAFSDFPLRPLPLMFSPFFHIGFDVFEPFHRLPFCLFSPPLPSLDGPSPPFVLFCHLNFPPPLCSPRSNSSDMAVHSVKFHETSGKVISSDAGSIKIWDKTDGAVFTSITPNGPINDLYSCEGSGLMMTAGEETRLQIYYVPRLGHAPK